MATLSPCCVSGKLHNHIEPKGREIKLGSLVAYETGDVANKAKTIVFLTDVFGQAIANARGLADAYADAGFYVVIPDILSGDPLPESLLSAIVPLPSQTAAKSEEQKAAEAATLGATFPGWVAKHGEAQTKPLVEEAVKALRADPAVKKIGAVGFCFGGRYAVLLGQKSADPFVDAVVAQHPSFLGIPDDVKGTAKPTLVNVGDEDAMLLSPAQAQLKEVWAKEAAGVDTKINVFDGATHGFTVRGDLSNDVEKDQQDKAFKATIDWFQKYLS